VASWTNDSELDPQQITRRRHPLVTHPAQLVMISVAISVVLTLLVAWGLYQAAFHFCWGCGSAP
jgi:uncharacterized membrane protein YdbT with pleckstrin-like domain